MMSDPSDLKPRRRAPLLALIPPPLAFLVAIGITIGIDRTAPGPLLWAWPSNLFGAAVMMLGGALAISAVLTFQRAGVSSRLFQGSHRVVAHGPFGLSRNPMYLSLVITAVGVATWMGHLLPYAGAVALFLWFDRVFIPSEERVLADHFGDQWTAYAARVRRWI
jgi:protein-S-isoprenylcysteine O-methyltransferase Ste14